MKPNPKAQRSIENLIRSEVAELKKNSMAEMLKEMVPTGFSLEAIKEAQNDMKFMFLLGQVAELHAILYLAKIEPKRIQVKQSKKPKKKVQKKGRRK